MSGDNEKDYEQKELDSWAELPIEERRAMRRAAQSQIWWTELGRKIKGLGPFITLMLAAAALWQLAGEWIREALTK